MRLLWKDCIPCTEPRHCHMHRNMLTFSGKIPFSYLTSQTLSSAHEQAYQCYRNPDFHLNFFYVGDA